MTKSARRKRREAAAALAVKPPIVIPTYTLLEMKMVTYRPYERRDGEIGWAELGFPCCRITVQNDITGQVTTIGYSNKSGHIFTITTPHGVVYRYGAAQFESHCKQRYGISGLGDCIIDFAN
jgi:hypothetical protein